MGLSQICPIPHVINISAAHLKPQISYLACAACILKNTILSHKENRHHWLEIPAISCLPCTLYIVFFHYHTAYSSRTVPGSAWPPSGASQIPFSLPSLCLWNVSYSFKPKPGYRPRRSPPVTSVCIICAPHVLNGPLPPLHFICWSENYLWGYVPTSLISAGELIYIRMTSTCRCRGTEATQ